MKTILISGGIFLVLVILPVIPVMCAAVVPNPVYQRVWVSILKLFASYWQVGMSYQFGWYSFVAIGLLMGIGWILQRFLVLKIAGKK